MSTLQYLIRNRMQLEEELPAKEKAAAEGFLGTGAVPYYKEIIESVKHAELEILASLGNPC